MIGGALVGLPTAGNRLLAGQIVLGKLVFFPAMVALCLFLGDGWGWLNLSEQLRIAVILSAAIPMITIYGIIAQDYDQGPLAALSMLSAVIVAFVTLSVLLAVLL